FVLFDQDGPGAIVRWWMTFWKAENGILRIYLDKDSLPEIEGAPFDVISGQFLAEAPFSESVPAEAPLNERGHNLYVPITFSEHCKITYECDSLREQEKHFWPDVFYNICYREYEEGTRVETFSMEKLKKAKPFFDKTKEALLGNFSPEKIINSFNKEILPGDSIVFMVEDKDAAISLLSLEINSQNQEQTLRSTVISMEFDGQQTVWVPVGEFFGTGYKMLTHKTWVNQTEEEGLMKSSYVMPYQEKCRLVYFNYGKETIHLIGEIGLADYKWQANSMYFGACWHEYYHLKTRNKNDWFFDLNFVDIQGKGMYVGDQITLFNMANTWWGEGDEKIFVDGEKFPSSIGTGSEDYYGYAFGHPEPFSHPFISEPSGEGNFVPGLVINMRHRSLDAIPFNSSISTNIEMWHWASTCVNYALTSYFYIQTPFEINIKPDIKSVQLPVATTKENFYGDESEEECFTIEELR
ncbi:glycoside hydrolase family 172 protein, partial [Bacteroidota bacterium]